MMLVDSSAPMMGHAGIMKQGTPFLKTFARVELLSRFSNIFVDDGMRG